MQTKLQPFQATFIPIYKTYRLLGQQFQLTIKGGTQSEDFKAFVSVKQLDNLKQEWLVLVHTKNQNSPLSAKDCHKKATLCQIQGIYYSSDPSDNEITLTLVAQNYLDVNQLHFDQPIFNGIFNIESDRPEGEQFDINYKSLLDAWYRYLKAYQQEAYQMSSQIRTQIKNYIGFCKWLAPMVPYNDPQNQILINAIIQAKTLSQAYNIFNGYLNQLIMQVSSSNDHLMEQIINNEAMENLKKYNEEVMLKEKSKLIQKMLDQNDDDVDPVQHFIEQVQSQKIAPESLVQIVRNEQTKIQKQPNNPEVTMSKNYLDLIINLPWKIVNQSVIDIKKIRNQLDLDHYGLKEIKDRIVEYLAAIQNVQQNNPSQQQLRDYENHKLIDDQLFTNQKALKQNPTLCLVGPPGVGKTSIAKSIAKALNRPFIKIALGGLSDEAELRGHRKTYVGAMSGKIISAIRRAGVSNPIILLDEIEKIQTSFKGNPANVLLEVLDPEQNPNFQDHYLDLEYDLSQVFFIATANDPQAIDPALSDRLEIINLSAYTIFEKIAIAKNHLLPKIYRKNGLEPKEMILDDQTIEFLIKHYIREAGVRQLNQHLDKIARKIVLEIVSDAKMANQERKIDNDAIKKYLGVIHYESDKVEKKAIIGCVNGMAYTGYGGDLIPIEVVTYPSQNPGLKLTGSLKDVMQESAQIALGYLKANYNRFGINFNFDHQAIHLHVPAGAIPKDGPSAGITFTSALCSALLKKPISQSVAMTGEITLRGKILPIGGLKEKTIAAYQQGIKTVYLPAGNQKDLADLNPEVLKAIKFIPVATYDDLFQFLFR